MDILRTFVWLRVHLQKKRQTTWVEMLSMALFVLNDTPGGVAPYNPRQIEFGINPMGPFEVPQFTMPTVNATAEEWIDTIQDWWDTVKRRLTVVNQKLIVSFEQSQKVVNFWLGDTVLVRKIHTLVL